MDQEIRNRLRNVVTQCRRLLEDSISQELEGKYAIFAKKDQVTADPDAPMTHLTAEEKEARRDILDHYAHIAARGFKPKDALDQLIREIAFTHLNRLCAYKMMEAREVYVGGQKFREAVSRGVNSNGVKFYLAEHPDDERLFNTGHQDLAYRHFLDWLGGQLSEEIGVLFSPTDPANRLYPRQNTLDEVLSLLNTGGIRAEETELREQWPQIWSQDETIGWVYQYFTPKELRDQARKESQAPRNSYELAFRNQFFTPRYVVEFLTDNTLGRIWYEMQQGRTRLVEQCRYLVRRPDEVFLSRTTADTDTDDAVVKAARQLTEGTEESFPVFDAADSSVQRMIAMAHCVSAYERFGEAAFQMWNADDGPRHATRMQELSTQFLLDWLFMTCRADRFGGDGEVYQRDWFITIANEIRRRAISSRGEASSQEQLLKAPIFVPFRAKKDPRELKILDPACGSGHFLLYCFDLLLTIYEEAYVDPDLGPQLQLDYPSLDALRRDVPRLILAHNVHGIDIDLRASQIAALALWLRCQRAYQEMGLRKDRPKITRSNFVCAEPMPGEEQMLREFVGQLEPKVLGQVVEVVFDKMKLAGEAGSLLKIEEEIRDAVAAARKQYVRDTTRAIDRKGQPLLFTESAMDSLAGKPEPQSLFDLSDITDDQFFEEAESRVIGALRSYAEKANSGERLQRRLFTEDAVRGFAFVDLCQNRYDVALMNPPFGKVSCASETYISATYKTTWKDAYACFIERAVMFAENCGKVGAITSSLFLYSKQLRELRRQMLTTPLLEILVELGSGVLDTATVDTAVTVLSRQKRSTAHFLDLTTTDKKGTALLTHQLTTSHNFLEVSHSTFLSLHNWPICYHVRPEIMSLWKRTARLEPNLAVVVAGNHTFDDERFIRLRWEIAPSAINEGWFPYEKGGAYQPFYSPTELIVNFANNGREMRDHQVSKYGTDAQVMQSVKWWFIPGIAFPRISSIGFGVKVMAAGQMFSEKGMCIFPNDTEAALPLLAVLASSWIEDLLCAFGRHRAYENSAVANLPITTEDIEHATANLRQLATECIKLMHTAESANETSPVFTLPHALRWWRDVPYSDPDEFCTDRFHAECRARLKSAYKQLDKAIEQILFDRVAPALTSTRRCDLVDSIEILSDDSPSVVVGSIYGYMMGVKFGRWDVRLAIPDTPIPELGDPFSALPTHPPASLHINTNNSPSGLPDGYRVCVNSGGILCDDPEHEDDIIACVTDVSDVIYGIHSSKFEAESCEILRVNKLREYFRKPGKGGFWDDHISRYSKSRRKAPIYWLLQSSKKNYALWLYYHRLDKDLLFKALVNYVEPKIRLEVSRLETLQAQRSTAGESAKEAKRLGKEIEKQEDFLKELRDFEEKLRSAANLNLDPDLNDGVVLNIAPLRELVPWREAQKYWDELREGKYEWSSIAKQLRQKGMVK